MIKGLLSKIKDKIHVDIQMDEKTFMFSTTTTILGEVFSKVDVDASPMYEVFKQRLIKDLKLKIK